jgi:hypothetical protein
MRHRIKDGPETRLGVTHRVSETRFKTAKIGAAGGASFGDAAHSPRTIVKKSTLLAPTLAALTAFAASCCAASGAITVAANAS